MATWICNLCGIELDPEEDFLCSDCEEMKIKKERDREPDPDFGRDEPPHDEYWEEDF